MSLMMMLSKLTIQNLVMPFVSLNETCTMRMHMSCNVVQQLNTQRQSGSRHHPIWASRVVKQDHDMSMSMMPCTSSVYKLAMHLVSGQEKCILTLKTSKFDSSVKCTYTIKTHQFSSRRLKVTLQLHYRSRQAHMMKPMAHGCTHITSLPAKKMGATW